MPRRAPRRTTPTCNLEGENGAQAGATTAGEYTERFAALDRLLSNALPELTDFEAVAEAVDPASAERRKPARTRTREGRRKAGSAPQQPLWLDRFGLRFVHVSVGVGVVVTVIMIVLVARQQRRSGPTSVARRAAADYAQLSKVL